MSLTLLGTGIHFFAHLSQEAISYIKSADKLLYLVNDPATKLWLEQQNQSAESLDFLYVKNTNRDDNYQLISKYILTALQNYKNVCVALYGHPTIFATPALLAARVARENGEDVMVLPAISAEDCLFADLLIDPGNCGCMSVEATDFFLYQRNFDLGSHLILWQVGVIGAKGQTHHFDNSKNIILLQDYLLDFYHKDHQAILYEASHLTGIKPKILPCKISCLEKMQYTPLSTLYIPPAYRKQYDVATFQKLRFDID